MINSLIERVARLEASKPRQRIRNQQEAAVYLNVSVSKLAGLHRLGRGPKRSRNGRNWNYLDTDLDAYLAAQIEEG